MKTNQQEDKTEVSLEDAIREVRYQIISCAKRMQDVDIIAMDNILLAFVKALLDKQREEFVKDLDNAWRLGSIYGGCDDLENPIEELMDKAKTDFNELKSKYSKSN